MLLSFRGVDPCILHLEFVRSGELGGCATSVPFGKKELPREPMHLRGMCDMLATARATCRNAQPLDVQKLSRRKSNGRQENLCRFSGFVRAGGRSGLTGNGETIDLVPQRNKRESRQFNPRTCFCGSHLIARSQRKFLELTPGMNAVPQRNSRGGLGEGILGQLPAELVAGSAVGTQRPVPQRNQCKLRKELPSHYARARSMHSRTSAASGACSAASRRQRTASA